MAQHKQTQHDLKQPLKLYVNLTLYNFLLHFLKVLGK